MQIDASQVKGESGTGYEGPQKGPFSCSNCEYFNAGSCGQKTMMAESKRPRVAGGRVQVDPEGCCEYIDRIGPLGKNRPGKRMMGTQKESK